MSKQRFAVFDIDGTIFRSSLTVELIKQLIRDSVFPEEAQAVYANAHERWLDREGDYETYIVNVVESFLANIKGVDRERFVHSAELVVAAQWKHTYQYTRYLLKDLKSRGYYLLAISHSPKLVLDKFCTRLGFDKVYGLRYELDEDDKFTGSVLDADIATDKAHIVRRAIDKETLMLTNSIGVGDTESDIPFLEIVARPICFNPNKKLFDYAKREKWRVVVERKDVIYSF